MPLSETLQVLLPYVSTGISLAANVYLAAKLQKRSYIASEFATLEKLCEKQKGEIGTLNQEIGKLKERTDLQPLMKEILDWRNEGRQRFEAATEQLKANTEAVVALTKVIMQRVNQSES